MSQTQPAIRRLGVSVQTGPDGQEHEFDASSVLDCECGLQVKVGSGGFRNMDIHRASQDHARHMKYRSKVPAVRKLKNGSLSSFFKPKTSAIPGPLAPPPLGRPSSASLAALAPSEPSQYAIIRDLQRAIATLPTSVPEATRLDTLATFAPPYTFPQDILDDVPARQSLWEDLDLFLNGIFGPGCSQDSIIALIRRGPLGVQALCDWIEAHIRHAGIDEGLFHGKVNRIMDAIAILSTQDCAHASSSAGNATTAAAPSIEVIDLTIDAPVVPPSESAPTSSPIPSADAAIPGTHCDGAVPTKSKCYGLPVDLGPDRVGGAAYPWGMDISRRFAWRGNAVDGKLYIRSTFCLESVASPPCRECLDLRDRPLVANVIRRMTGGVSQFTNTLFLSWENMYDSNGWLRKENNKQKLGALALARKLTSLTSTVDNYNRLVWAIANDDIPRAAVVLKVALNNNRGVCGMLSQVEKAAKQVYRARSYSEKDYALATLFYRLGGSAVSSLASRALGLPSPESIRRHSHVPAIRVSSGYPTSVETVLNIDKMYPEPIPPPLHGTRTGVVLMIDECKVEERLRWDASTNFILGTCREHSQNLDLEFRNLDSALAVASGLKDKTVHLAKEMTVAALGPLVRNSRDNVARPIHISGTCKLEDAAAQSGLLRTLLTTATSHPKLCHARVYSIATDGESRRGKALVPLTLCQRLSEKSPLYASLSRLSLFNLLCGPDEVTLSKDPKHIFKRMRGTLLRRAGVSVLGTVITPALLKQHLLHAGLSPEHTQSLVTLSDEAPCAAVQVQLEKHLIGNGLTPSRVRALMNPNDKQDVPLAYSLLVAIMKLPAPLPDDSVTWITTRRALNLLGAMFGCFLKPFVTLSMSAGEQLRLLSEGMHLMLALYSDSRGAFIPVQLYADTSHMVKNAVFTLAKTQVDNPNGDFFLCLDGSDRLEDEFGNMCCIVGNDSNADILQGSSRLSSAAEVSILFGEHPEWDRTKRRLQLKPLEEQGALLDRGVDHVSPRSWTGDLNISRVSLLTSWTTGRLSAEDQLRGYGTEAPFSRMEAQGNIDILRPLGTYCFNDELLDGEVNEESEVHTPMTEAQVAQSDELDVEDYAGAELAEQLRAQDGPAAAAEPWIFMTPGDPSSRVFKASVLRLVLDPVAPLVPGSTDRLKRVRGEKRFNDSEEQDEETPSDALSSASSARSVVISDVAATLLRCCDAAFMGIIQVSSLTAHGKATQVLQGPMLDDTSNIVGFQVLRLVPQDASQCDGYDWYCAAETVRFGSADSLLTTSAPLIQPLKPATVIPADGSPPYMRFTSDELRALTLLLLEKVEQDTTIALPSVSKAPRFPYALNDKYCFAAQKPDKSSVGVDKLKCDRCSSKVKIDSVPGLVNHIAAHTLYDANINKNGQYCGFCFSSDDKCRFYLRKKGDNPTNQQLDLDRCVCPRLPAQFSYNSASKSKKTSPSSNVPIWCPACPEHAPAVWKYNLKRHFETQHPLSNPNDFKKLWKLERDELTGLSTLWGRICNSRKSKKASTTPTLAISEAHSSLMAMEMHESELDSDDEDARNSALPVPIRTAVNPNDPNDETEVNRSDAASMFSVPQNVLEDDGRSVGSCRTSAASRAPITAAPPPAPGRPFRKRGRAVIEELCICGEEATVQGIDQPSGCVECIGPGCETHWFHEECAKGLKGTRELALPFVCPSCAKSSSSAAKRARTG